MTKILYVEDHKPQRDILQQMLELQGFEVAIADDGTQGVQKARQFHPDVILMDLRLPIMSGHQATKILKEDPDLRDIPVIILSAWSDKKSRETALEAGAEVFLKKPVAISTLIAAINKILSVTDEDQ